MAFTTAARAARRRRGGRHGPSHAAGNAGSAASACRSRTRPTSHIGWNGRIGLAANTRPARKRHQARPASGACGADAGSPRATGHSSRIRDHPALEYGAQGRWRRDRARNPVQGPAFRKTAGNSDANHSPNTWGGTGPHARQRYSYREIPVASPGRVAVAIATAAQTEERQGQFTFATWSRCGCRKRSR